jgi:hypothetical protein
MELVVDDVLGVGDETFYLPPSLPLCVPLCVPTHSLPYSIANASLISIATASFFEMEIIEWGKLNWNFFLLHAFCLLLLQLRSATTVLRLKREPRRKAKAKDRLATLLNGI